LLCDHMTENLELPPGYMNNFTIAYAGIPGKAIGAKLGKMVQSEK